MSDDVALLKASDRELLLATVSPPASRAKPRTPLLTFVYVVIAALGNNLFGYELSVISAAKLDFANEFNISTDSAQYGLLASGLPIGATLGAVLAGYLQSIAGRRYTLAIASAIYCGAVIVSYYSSGFLMLAWGRLQTGVAVGLFSSTAPLYIAEIAPSHIRGKLVTFNQVLVVFGVLLGYAACKLFSPQWRLMFVAGLPLAALLLLAFIFVTPYSPRWLMTKGREREARAVLNALRGGTIVSGTGKGALLEAEGRGGAASIVQHGKGAISDIDSAVGAELEGMRRAVAGAATTTQWDQLREPWVLKAIFVGVFLAFIQQWCGVNAANAYAPDILKNAGFSAADALTQGIYIGVVKLVTIFIALGLMDRFGRRELLLVGTAGMAVSLAGLGAALSIASSPPLLSAGCLFGFLGLFEIGLGPVMWLLLSELYPLSVRGPAMAMGSTSCWINTVAVTFLFPLLSGAMGMNGVFFMFSGVCVLAMVWLWLFVPETRGKTLEEIEVMLREGRVR